MALQYKRRGLSRIVPKLLVVIALIATSSFTTAAAQAQDGPEDDLSSLLPDDAGARFVELHQRLGISSPLDSLVG